MLGQDRVLSSNATLTICCRGNGGLRPTIFKALNNTFDLKKKWIFMPLSNTMYSCMVWVCIVPLDTAHCRSRCLRAVIICIMYFIIRRKRFWTYWIMLSIQAFVTIVNTFVLLLVLGVVLKLCRAVQNREQGPVEDNSQPRRFLPRDQLQYNNSVPCNRKRATEHDDF